MTLAICGCRFAHAHVVAERDEVDGVREVDGVLLGDVKIDPVVLEIAQTVAGVRPPYVNVAEQQV